MQKHITFNKITVLLPDSYHRYNVTQTIWVLFFIFAVLPVTINNKNRSQFWLELLTTPNNPLSIPNVHAVPAPYLYCPIYPVSTLRVLSSLGHHPSNAPPILVWSWPRSAPRADRRPGEPPTTFLFQWPSCLSPSACHPLPLTWPHAGPWVRATAAPAQAFVAYQ